MLEQARSFAEQGVAKAGPELLASAQHRPGARIYVRIMTRLRQHEPAFATVQKALAESAANLPILKQQMEKEGFAGVTDAQWRENMRRSRTETARAGMTGALQEMGNAVNTYFTPEERLAFAHFAESRRAGMNPEDVEHFAIPLAESAALADQEAHWRFERMMQRAALPNQYSSTQPFIELQRRRGRFAELGPQMEQFAEAVPLQQRVSPLLAAADAYRSAGDEPNELRVLSRVFSTNGLDPTRQQRFFQLLLARQPQELARIASMWPVASGEQAANYAIAHGDAALSHTVVEARGQARPPVWNKAYNALVGLYFLEPTPDINNAFLAALGDDPIRVRLARPVDRTQQLAGNTWFYYGSRYGEYLGTARLGDPEDFLPAILEESPASASGYLTLADYYAGTGDTKRAIADYNHTLELSPNRPDVYDSLAAAYYKQGDHAGALVQWKQALAVLSKQLNTAHLPESFWADFGRTCDQLAARHMFGELKPDADAIVRTYLRHNGNYRSHALLRPAYAATGDPATATAWLLDLSSAAHDPTLILAELADASWIPLAQRAPIYQRILQSKESAVTKLNGLERQYADQELSSWQVRWVRYLVRAKQYGAAAAAIAALPQETRDAHAATLVPLELQVAVQLGTLDSKLTAYRTEPQSAPAPEILRSAARRLFESGDKQSARKILELAFSREIEEHKLLATNFLGLAEIRLALGDTAGALDLLHRLVVAVGNPFENLDPAAALLEKTGHNAEAIEFLDQLVKSAPWEPSYRSRLARAKLASDNDAAAAHQSLTAIAAGPNTPYALRLKAAVALAGRPHSDLGSGELNLLADSRTAIRSAAGDKFYFYEARIKAAQNVADPQTKIQLLSHCIIDFPRREEARVPLFEAAAAAQSNEYALGVLEPLFQTQFLRTYAPEAGNEEEQIVSSGYEEEESDDESNAPAAAAVKLSRAQQAQVARMIGDTMSGLNRLSDAVSYYQTARQLEHSPAIGKTLLRKIADAKAMLRIQRQNAARQPLLHEALEQDRVVRPQLLARAAPAPKTAAAKGGVKQ
jgi:predicted Zn-dependent protease